ncbi:HTH-type transcriptional regulator YesS [compost metagenome]
MNEYVKSGILVINLKEDLLYDAVVNINKGRFGNIAILNPTGEVISYKDKNMLYQLFDAFDEIPTDSHEGYFVHKINGINTFVSYMKSDLNGWRYLALSPANEVFKKSNDVLKITLTITGLCLLLGILLMYLVSGRYYSSIRKIVQSIERQFGGSMMLGGNRDEFSFISQSFEHVFEQNEQFKLSFQQNELILRDHFLLNLVLGKTIDSEELHQQLDYYKLDLNLTDFVVMVLRLHVDHLPLEKTEPSKNVVHFQVHSICQQVIQSYTKGIVLNTIQNNEMAIILNQPETVEVKLIAAQIRDAIHEQLQISSTLGIGGYYQLVTEISYSYSEAVDSLLHERIAGKGSILSFQDVIVNQLNRKSFLAYKDKTEKLIHELKAANADKAKAIKDQIMEQLQEDSQSSFSYKNMILTQIVNGIVTILLEVNAKMEELFTPSYNIHYEFGKLTSLSQMSLWFNDVFDHTINYIHDKRKNKNSDLINQITAYIEEHHSEPLSLQEMADSIFMNANYVSKLFKEVTGQTFLEYLTEFRFKRACQMLLDSDQGIHDIAEASGFGHKQNLIRVFRKKLGETPTEFRKANAK